MRQLKIVKQITNRDDASLDLYLQEIGKVSLISIADEVNLDQKIKNGDQKALEMLITANLRFVVSVAKQYQYKGLSLSDLINEGNLGLIKAAERFDELRGFRFISYAVWWIRQTILQALAENSRIVRLPLNKIGSLTKINSAFARFEQDYQREPVPEEITELLKFEIKVVEQAFQTANYHISFDAPLHQGEGDENSLYDLLVNNDALSPDIALVKNSLEIEINRALTLLPERDAEILCHYFGLNGKKPLLIDEIAIKMKLTSERVRQLKVRAIKRLKNHRKISLLRPFLG